MIGWAHTIYAFLHALALASDLAQHWSRDLAPWEVRARLVEDYGAVLPEDMIRPLDEEHDVPDDLPAPLVYEFFESFTAGKEQFADRGFSVGGRQTRGDHPALPTAVFYQLGGEADCGLLAAIVAEYDALMARALGGAELSPDERKWTLMASCVLEYMEAEQERLLKLGMECSTVHFVAYLEPGAVNCHRDVRLDSPDSLRAIFAAPSSQPSSAKRLQFWLSEGRLDRSVRRFFGACGGNVMLTGQGSGGFRLVPEEVTGERWFLWHEPWGRADGGDSRRYKREDIRGSFVFSGSRKEASKV